jgi:hypothetical protein
MTAAKTVAATGHTAQRLGRILFFKDSRPTSVENDYLAFPITKTIRAISQAQNTRNAAGFSCASPNMVPACF